MRKVLLQGVFSSWFFNQTLSIYVLGLQGVRSTPPSINPHVIEVHPSYVQKSIHACLSATSSLLVAKSLGAQTPKPNKSLAMKPSVILRVLGLRAFFRLFTYLLPMVGSQRIV